MRAQQGVSRQCPQTQPWNRKNSISTATDCSGMPTSPSSGMAISPSQIREASYSPRPQPTPPTDLTLDQGGGPATGRTIRQTAPEEEEEE
jgi:hypothetical protein